MRLLTSSWMLRWIAVACFATLVGCATTEQAPAPIQPEPAFAGTLAIGDLRGERSAPVQAAMEAAALQVFPRAQWMSAKGASPDIALDIVVHSARMNDVRSSQETRNCRRYSEPDRDAKGALQRLLSVKCLDWEVRQVPCLTRTYEIDVQFRARSDRGMRLIASDRKVHTAADRQCGNTAPATAPLEVNAESQAARWAMDQLRAPLAQWSRAAQPPTVAIAPAPVSPSTVSSPASDPPRPTATPPGYTVTEAHALIIGNAAYPGSARLANPVNDARGVARKFSEMGFRVTLIENTDRAALIRELDRFHAAAAQSQVTVLYYSGHGMQIDGVNYLLPTDINLAQPSTLRLQGVSVNSVVDAYLPGRTRLVFLDACRDNPGLTAQTRGARRGLAPIDAPQGTLISYATRDGGVAEDGAGQHSPFTQALLELITEPEDISLVLRKVRDRVMGATAGRQQPWEYGSLSGGALVLPRLVARPAGAPAAR